MTLFYTFSVCLVSLTLCLAKNELTFMVTVPERNENVLRIYSNAHDIVAALFNDKDKLIDCDVFKKTKDVKELFYQALSGKIGNDRVVQDMDVPLLARQCKKFLRGMRRKKPEDRSKTVREVKKRLEIKDGINGTNWCRLEAPVGVTKNNYGSEKDVDKCCQQYHSCAETIQAFHLKYNLYNYYYYKLPSCECREEFNKCLNKVKTATSKHVRQLFFKTIEISCFQLTEDKTCIEWDKWYTKCNKYKKESSAVRKF